MAAKLFSTIALACMLAMPAQATSLYGPVDLAMFQKAGTITGPVEIASPGGNMIFSMAIAGTLKQRGIPVRVTGWCASGCAMIAIGSGNCTVARSGHLVLHAPVLPPGGNVTDAARVLKQGREGWMKFMRDAGVPEDVLDATLQAYGQRLELSTYGMKRVGCAVE
jgi:hypothetical protein